MNTSKQEAIDTLVATLRPFRLLNLDPDYYCVSDVDSEVREIVRAALRALEVYDACGCPLCLS